MRRKQLYDELVGLLSLNQYRKLMGGTMTYADKARRSKLVSKSKKVHGIADEIILIDFLESYPVQRQYSGDGQPGDQS